MLRAMNTSRSSASRKAGAIAEAVIAKALHDSSPNQSGASLPALGRRRRKLHAGGRLGVDLGGALGADQFGPDAEPRLLADIPRTDSAVRGSLDPSRLLGAHLSPRRQALVEVCWTDASHVGELAPFFRGPLLAHGPHL